LDRGSAQGCSRQGRAAQGGGRDSVDGADGPGSDKTPDFVKSLPIWKALDENTIVAFGMNGQALPHFNGFPARLVVPGWTATYWMKHLVTIERRPSPSTASG
jgi:sulfite dehydrogenase (cytochrome) subunit A